MPHTALGEGGGLPRTHSEPPKTINRPPESGLADFRVKNLKAYELSGLAPNGSLNQLAKRFVKPSSRLPKSQADASLAFAVCDSVA